MSDEARRAADELTEARFGKAQQDPIVLGIGAAIVGWLITLLAFVVSNVPERMIGHTPDIMAGICGVAVFSYLHWRKSRRAKFWTDSYAMHLKRGKD